MALIGELNKYIYSGGGGGGLMTEGSSSTCLRTTAATFLHSSLSETTLHCARFKLLINTFWILKILEWNLSNGCRKFQRIRQSSRGLSSWLFGKYQRKVSKFGIFQEKTFLENCNTHLEMKSVFLRRISFYKIMECLFN